MSAEAPEPKKRLAALRGTHIARRLLERCQGHWAGNGEVCTIVAEVVAEFSAHYQLLQKALNARLRVPASV
jgi:hypothetical protein